MDVIELARIDLSSGERVEHERIVRVGTVGYVNVSLHRSLRIAEMKNGFSSSRSAAIPPRTHCRSNALLPATPLQQREPAGSHCSLAASRQDPRPPSTRPAPT